MNKKVIIKKKKLHYIKARVKKNKHIDSTIYFADLETILENDAHVPVVITILRGDKINTFKNIDEFMRFLIEKRGRSIIYFHNFGRFDSTFIINWIIKNYDLTGELDIIERNNIIYEVVLKKYNIRLRDSYLIIPVKLEDIGKNFCDKYSKNAFEYGDITEIYKSNEELIINQCINDCRVLEEGFNNFNSLIDKTFGIPIHHQLTLPSLAMNIFKKMYYNDIENRITKNPYDVDEFIRKSYVGGISEVFKPYLKDGYCYDANSLYPFVMKNYKYPVGDGYFVKGCDIDINNFIGFIECEVTCDQELNYLTYRDDKLGLITPTGQWTATYFHVEILKAIKLGYKIKYIKGYKYDKEGYIFKDYVESLYEIRIKSNNSMNKIAKLLMNSLYGRFGMKSLVLSTKFIKSTDLAEIKKSFSIKRIEHLGADLYSISYIKVNANSTSSDYYSRSIDTETAVQIASAVTAYARTYMYDFKTIKGNECYYTDTDSIFLKKPLDDKYIGTELGMFKKEYNVKEAYFIAPKVYTIKKDDDSMKIVVKGIKKSEVNVDEIIKYFDNLVNGIEQEDYLVFRENHFKRDLIKLKTYVERININYSFPFNKRIKVIKSGKWIDTRSIRIKK